MWWDTQQETLQKGSPAFNETFGVASFIFLVENVIE
jgi:hypothetical protein